MRNKNNTNSMENNQNVKLEEREDTQASSVNESTKALDSQTLENLAAFLSRDQNNAQNQQIFDPSQSQPSKYEFF